MTSLDAIIIAARQSFEANFPSLNFISSDGITYDSGVTMQAWTGYRAGYVQATKEFHKTFAGHVYISDADYSALIANQIK